MKKNFMNSVKMSAPGRNTFDLTHDVKLSMDMGELIPSMCMPVIPGDQFTLGCQSLVRFAPLIAPVMHRFDVTCHYFFVPNRLVWPNWEKFITNGGDDPADAGDPLPAFPTIQVTDVIYARRLADYLGLPEPTSMQSAIVSALPFAAYQLIYDEYYRDQNLIDKLNPILADGDNSASTKFTLLRRRAWEHDVFTSALPNAQKGQAVDIPLGDVKLNPDVNTPGYFVKAVGHAPQGTTGNVTADGTTGRTIQNGTDVVYDPRNTLTTEPTTINDLRRAIKLQEWLEKAARGGSRYIEQIKVFFGIQSSDKRLQRPEYIGGMQSPVVISEVLNTTGTEDLPQGNMAGHAFAAVKGQYSKYFAEEHGYIIGMLSVRPKTAYQQGIPAHFLQKTDPTDFFWPQFANLGEEAIQQQEVFAYGATPTEPFGYRPRYSLYRYENNRVAGEFRDELNFWHEGRIFETEPTLSKEFVECTPSNRIFAAPFASSQHLYVQILNEVKASRPVPFYGTPTF